MTMTQQVTAVQVAPAGMVDLDFGLWNATLALARYSKT